MKNNGKRKSSYPIIGFVLVLTLVVAGCKTKQKITATTPQETKKEIASKPKQTSPQINVLDYKWLSYRMNISVLDYTTKKETISVSVFFVNRKDSVIYLNIGKMGIEGARIVITPDSVKYINHLNRTYYCGDYVLVNKLLGFTVNFYLLQAIFTGEDLPGFEPNMLETITQDTTIYHSPLRRNRELGLSVLQELKVNASHKVVANSITELQTGVFMGMQYGDFITVDESRLFFQRATVVIPSEKIQLNCTLKNIKLNLPGPTSIRIPEKYTPVEIK
jgi:hypothetical protein